MKEEGELKTMERLNYNNAITISRDLYWVGFYDKEAHLHCNPYILVDEDDIVFFDPGSIPHFPTVMRKVIDIVNPEDISVIVASHQDPDVCGSLAVVEDVINRKDLRIEAHSNSTRLIRHLGLRSNLYDVDKHDNKLTLKSGRVLDFIPAPFLHSPGAIVTYDSKTKTLFSGDLFGAVSEDWSLFASGDFYSPMDAFHRMYMPNNRTLKPFMEKLEKYEIELILPQHGSIIEGKEVSNSISHLKGLACGLDLQTEET